MLLVLGIGNLCVYSIHPNSCDLQGYGLGHFQFPDVTTHSVIKKNCLMYQHAWPDKLNIILTFLRIRQTIPYWLNVKKPMICLWGLKNLASTVTQLISWSHSWKFGNWKPFFPLYPFYDSYYLGYISVHMNLGSNLRQWDQKCICNKM